MPLPNGYIMSMTWRRYFLYLLVLQADFFHCSYGHNPPLESALGGRTTTNDDHRNLPDQAI